MFNIKKEEIDLGGKKLTLENEGTITTNNE